jgi:hypothetical protein
MVKAVPFRSLERTDRSPASAITEKINYSLLKMKSFEKAHVRFYNVFHLITRALKRTVGFAGLKAGKQGLISL